MRRPSEIAAERTMVQSVSSLTSAFEGLASMHIMRNKNKVLQSRAFFQDIWSVYVQLRVSKQFRYGRSARDRVSKKKLMILIASDTGLSGDINQRLIDLALQTYTKSSYDIVVIGKRLAVLLRQMGIPYIKLYRQPVGDDFTVEPVADLVKRYSGATIFYQSYESLTKQNIKSIELMSLLEMYVDSRENEDPNNYISESNYIFEPSVADVAAFFEKSMVQLAISESIFESRLAQDASRFMAMKEANDTAVERNHDLYLQLRKAKRNIMDQRLREITNGIRKIGGTV